MKRLIVGTAVVLCLTEFSFAKDEKPVRSKDYKQGVVDAYNCVDFVIAKYKFEGTLLTYVQAVAACRVHLGVDKPQIPAKGGDKKVGKKRKEK